MNLTTTARKIIYLAILVAMLIPLYLLGQPASPGDDGGQLSAMRVKYDIAESNLGEISPSSETMKLASLGLRGVAATMLWNKADTFLKQHEWDRYRAAADNIALLQPHFEKVWEYQAHNISYNISKEFDDYRQRYEMVREGTEFLIDGVRQNRKGTRLVWYTGWFYGQKIGISDEKRQFRRLFADDTEGHEFLRGENIPVDSAEARGPDGKPDNWLVGRLWLREGYDLVDSGVPIRRQTPLNFYQTGPKWRIEHAEAIEEEGTFDDAAITAWQNGAEDWAEFGDRSVPTTANFTIKLGRIEDLRQQREQKWEQFRQLAPEAYDAAAKRLYDALDADAKEILEGDPADLPLPVRELAENIRLDLIPKLPPLVEEVPEADRLKAIELIDEVDDLTARIDKTRGYREQINYGYWQSLAQAEQEERTVEARKLIYEARQARRQADPFTAQKKYEEAFAVWAEIFDDYPVLTINDSAEDLFQSIRRYMALIDSEELPDDFPLAAFVDLMGEYGQVPPDAYAKVRSEQAELTKRRQQELAEEERRREAEAEAASEAETPPEDAPEANPPTTNPSTTEDSVSGGESSPETTQPGAGNEESPQEDPDVEPEAASVTLPEVEEVSSND